MCGDVVLGLAAGLHAKSQFILVPLHCQQHPDHLHNQRPVRHLRYVHGIPSAQDVDNDTSHDSFLILVMTTRICIESFDLGETV
jgi:hypothetical protein